MSFVEPGKWTCPSCRVTELFDTAEARVGDAEAIQQAIRAAQEAHAADHPAPWVEPTRARHPVRRKADRANKTRRAQERHAERHESALEQARAATP